MTVIKREIHEQLPDLNAGELPDRGRRAIVSEEARELPLPVPEAEPGEAALCAAERGRDISTRKFRGCEL